MLASYCGSFTPFGKASGFQILGIVLGLQILGIVAGGCWHLWFPDLSFGGGLAGASWGTLERSWDIRMIAARGRFRRLVSNPSSEASTLKLPTASRLRCLACGSIGVEPPRKAKSEPKAKQSGTTARLQTA